MEHVKSARRYDSSGRHAEARRRQDAILHVAERQFHAGGYAGTTIAAIAAEAGASVETVYKVFGGKAGLVRSLYERGLAGAGPVPAYERSDAMREREREPLVIMHEWGLLAAEVSSRVTPVRLLMRAAAAHDVEMARLLDDVENARLDRMRHHALYLQERSYLRDGITLSAATDILWLCSSTELYELLVLKRGWSLPQFAEHVTRTMASSLLR